MTRWCSPGSFRIVSKTISTGVLSYSRKSNLRSSMPKVVVILVPRQIVVGELLPEGFRDDGLAVASEEGGRRQVQFYGRFVRLAGCNGRCSPTWWHRR